MLKLPNKEMNNSGVYASGLFLGVSKSDELKRLLSYLPVMLHLKSTRFIVARLTVLVLQRPCS